MKYNIGRITRITRVLHKRKRRRWEKKSKRKKVKVKEKKNRQYRLLGARIAGFKRFREWRRIKYRQEG